MFIKKSILTFFTISCIMLPLAAVDTAYYTLVNSTDKAITISFNPIKIQKGTDCSNKFTTITLPSRQSTKIAAIQGGCALSSFKVSQEKAIGSSYDIQTKEREISLTFTITRNLVVLSITRTMSPKELPGGQTKPPVTKPLSEHILYQISASNLDHDMPIKIFYKSVKNPVIEILYPTKPIINLRVSRNTPINSFQILGEAKGTSSQRPVLASYYPKETEEVFVIEKTGLNKFKILGA